MRCRQTTMTTAIVTIRNPPIEAPIMITNELVDICAALCEVLRGLVGVLVDSSVVLSEVFDNLVDICVVLLDVSACRPPNTVVSAVVVSSVPNALVLVCVGFT